MRLHQLRSLILVVICAALVLAPRSAVSLGLGMAGSVKKAVKDLDSKVSAQQQANASAAAAAKSGTLALLPVWDGTTGTTMDFRLGTTACPGTLASITTCDLYYTGGYFYSNAATNKGSLSYGWIADVGPVSGVSAIQSYPSSGHLAQAAAVAGHGYVMSLGDNTYAALYANTVPAPTTSTATFSPVYFTWVYPFEPSSLNQNWLLTIVSSGTGVGNVTSSPTGINCTTGGNGRNCSSVFANGTMVTLTPHAVSGAFLGWNSVAANPCTGGTGNCVFMGDRDVTLIANFSYMGVGVAVAGTNGGWGAITSSDGNINCGSTCAESFTSTTTVILTAVPDANSTFASWSAPCNASTGPVCVLPITGAGVVMSVTANFAGNRIAVTETDNGAGNVTSVPAGINCGNGGAFCTANFPVNTTVVLTATPASSSFFQGWGAGACVGKGTGTCTIVTNGSLFNVSADFHRPTLTVNTIVGTGTGTVVSAPAAITCTNQGPLGGLCGVATPFDLATNITLTATPTLGGDLVSWTPGACNNPNNNSTTCSFSIAVDTAATPLINRGGVIVTVVNPSSGTVTSVVTGTGALGTGLGNLNCGNSAIACATAVTPNASASNGAPNIIITATPNPGGPKVASWTIGTASVTVGGYNFPTVSATTATATTIDTSIQSFTVTFQ